MSKKHSEAMKRAWITRKRRNQALDIHPNPPGMDHTETQHLLAKLRLRRDELTAAINVIEAEINHA